MNAELNSSQTVRVSDGSAVSEFKKARRMVNYYLLMKELSPLFNDEDQEKLDQWLYQMDKYKCLMAKEMIRSEGPRIKVLKITRTPGALLNKLLSRLSPSED